MKFTEILLLPTLYSKVAITVLHLVTFRIHAVTVHFILENKDREHPGSLTSENNHEKKTENKNFPYNAQRNYHMKPATVVVISENNKKSTQKSPSML